MKIYILCLPVLIQPFARALFFTSYSDLTRPKLYHSQSLKARSRNSHNNATVSTASFGTVSSDEIADARRIIDHQLKLWGQYNKARFETPLRNRYTLKPESVPNLQTRAINIPELTPEITRAAALLAEVEVAPRFMSNEKGSSNITYSIRATSSAAKMAPFWMEQIPRVGSQPYGNDPSYQVRRKYPNELIWCPLTSLGFPQCDGTTI
jgi:hypothetical protein